MLKEEQAAVLLAKCELIVGYRLAQIRGNLRNAETRAAALWELLLLEAVSAIGRVEYEPLKGGSPDLRAIFGDESKVWFEAAYIYPRFWKEERRSEIVASWVYRHAQKLGIRLNGLQFQFYGDLKNKAGPIRRLPPDKDKNSFLSDPEFQKFLEDIRLYSDVNHLYSSSNYSLRISYYPGNNSSFITTTGLVQDSPKSVGEHAVYRALIKKSKQHSGINAPLVICVCSDQSRVLSISHGSNEIQVKEAIRVAMQKHTTISAILLVDIKDVQTWGMQVNRATRPNLFVNDKARHKLSETQLQAVARLNLNNWKYGFPLYPWELGSKDRLERVSGPATISYMPGRKQMDITIPANLVVDALAGKTDYIKAYAAKSDDPIAKKLAEGWVVEGCIFEQGNINKGEAPKLTLKLAPPPEKVFWPAKTTPKRQT